MISSDLFSLTKSKMDTTTTTKKCKRCGRELPIESFHKMAKSPDGHQPYCKDCRSEMASERTKKKRLSKVYSNPELAKFTPRQLMEELKSRGFRWDYMLEPQKRIMFDKI